VTWVDLQALARRPDLDPQLALLTLPVQKQPDLGPCTQRIGRVPLRGVKPEARMP
jgi:hypothetical protein